MYSPLLTTLFDTHVRTEAKPPLLEEDTMPLNTPTGPPSSPPEGCTSKPLSLTPPITTSSRGAQILAHPWHRSHTHTHIYASMRTCGHSYSCCACCIEAQPGTKQTSVPAFSDTSQALFAACCAAHCEAHADRRCYTERGNALTRKGTPDALKALANTGQLDMYLQMLTSLRKNVVATSFPPSHSEQLTCRHVSHYKDLLEPKKAMRNKEPPSA